MLMNRPVDLYARGVACFCLLDIDMLDLHGLYLLDKIIVSAFDADRIPYI